MEIDNKDIWQVSDDEKAKGIKYPLTGGGNFLRFRDQWRDTLRYAKNIQQWVAFDEKKGWLQIDRKDINHFADMTVDRIFDEARQATTEGLPLIASWAKRSQERYRLDDMIKMSEGREPFRVPIENTTKSGFINCENGVVNLRTGELIPYSKDNITLKRVNVAYDPKAVGFRWNQLFEEIFVFKGTKKADLDLIEFVQTALGYAITGENSEHKLFFCHGGGRNGKRTIFENIKKVLTTDYCDAVQFETFLLRNTSDARKLEAIGGLRDLRVAISSETREGTRLDEAIVKQVTGGDTLTGTVLNQSFYKFDPTHTIFLQCNHMPAFRDMSDGMKLRLCVIPFNATFQGTDRDLDLDRKLLTKEEKEGLFALLVKGAMRWYKNEGLVFPKSVKDETDEYIRTNDIIGGFIEEHMIKDGGLLLNTDMYERYKSWCRIEGKYVQPIEQMPERLRERKIPNKKTMKGKAYEGWSLRKLTGEEAPAYNPVLYS